MRRRPAATSASSSEKETAAASSPAESEDNTNPGSTADHESAQSESPDSSEDTHTLSDRLRGKVNMILNPHTVDLRAYGFGDQDSLTFDIGRGTPSIRDQLQRIHELRQLPLELEDNTLQDGQQLPQEGAIRIQVEDVKQVEQRAEDGIPLAQQTISIFKEVLGFYANN